VVKTADLCDHYSSLGVCENIFLNFGKKKRFNGPIHTVKVFEDNVLVKEALQTVPSGAVLVVDGGGSNRCALMGDRLATIAVERNLAGVIINGCIRDSAEINEMDIGVRALGTCPVKSKKEGKGKRDITVSFAGVHWKPGWYAYADEDGIVLSDKPLTLD
jgi:regulator of ribonuclease activity A